MHADRQQGIELGATNTADLILTGHNHDLFVNFDGRAAMAESSYDGHYVVIIDVAIEVTERDGRRHTTWWPQFRIVDTATVTPDPEVAATVAGFEGDLSREMDVTLATTAVELDSRNATVRTREAAIGNLIADAMRTHAKADVAVMNGGGIRSGKVFSPGSSITRRDVLAELPFGNRLVTLDMSGRDLLLGIENGLSRLPAAAGRFPQISGMTVRFDPSRPPESRVLSIRVGDAPLDPDKIYRVATNDFMAHGGDGYTSFKTAKSLLPADDSPMLVNDVMVYVRRLGTIRTGIEGRITPQ
jgi:2',3'-cyclic-nucleotide 2'-phosphodiesterase (5'-nucleotidase family)